MASLFSPTKAEQDQLIALRRIQFNNQNSLKKMVINKGHLNKNHQFLHMSKT
jgi:hypothetical protein